MLGQKVNQNGKQSPILNGIRILLVTIIFAVSAWFSIMMVVSPVIEMEHYNRVCRNPLAVTATVTEHKSYDDDGDTDYKSYISYEVNGISYTHISFEAEDEKYELTPVGEQVTVQVSPEDPSVLLSKLEGAWRMLIFGLLPFAAMLSGGWIYMLERKRTRASRGTPDREEIQRDLRLTVWGRFSGPFWLLLAIGYAFARWRYPVLVKEWVLIVAAVCGALWLWCVYRAMRDLKHIKNEEYELHRDVLVKKEDASDSDSETYYLHYKSRNRIWKTKTTRKKFNTAKEGTAVLAVYLPGGKKPILHYDVDGDAC